MNTFYKWIVSITKTWDALQNKRVINFVPISLAAFDEQILQMDITNNQTWDALQYKGVIHFVPISLAAYDEQILQMDITNNQTWNAL